MKEICMAELCFSVCFTLDGHSESELGAGLKGVEPKEKHLS